MSKVWALLLLIPLLAACAAPPKAVVETTVATTAAPVIETTAAATTTAPPETTVAVTEAEINPFPDIKDLTFEDLSGMTFTFLSGAGAWRTEMEIFSDGSFSGDHADSDMMTLYYCAFHGTFADLERVGPYTYSMKLETLVSEGVPADFEPPENTSEIIESSPYGLELAEEVLLFLPGKLRSELPEEVRVSWTAFPIDGDYLKIFAIYNVQEDYTFTVIDYSQYK